MKRLNSVLSYDRTTGCSYECYAQKKGGISLPLKVKALCCPLLGQKEKTKKPRGSAFIVFYERSLLMQSYKYIKSSQFNLSTDLYAHFASRPSSVPVISYRYTYPS